ncbi:MAG: tetratricopeptide repeat protein [Burkholderiaceae bacterium]|jgi:regulator of sirC expression with transglutaminase-like and TPR domain
MTPLDYFSTLVASGDDNESLPLTEAALAVAQDVYPRLDLSAVQLELDRLSATLKRRIPKDASQVQRLRALNAYFFKELGFAGNRNDYYDPDNSYLHRVLERRLGIPISLALLYMEIGQQVGLPLRGVSFPGHFLVKLKVRAGDIFLDPYSGQSLSREQLEERLGQFFDARGMEVPTELALIPSIQESSPRDILVRMLRNLKGIYHDRQDFEKLLAVQNRLVVLLPDAPSERRDRGLVYAQLDCPRAALEDLRHYLKADPDAPEAEEIRRTIASLEDGAGRST